MCHVGIDTLYFLQYKIENGYEKVNNKNLYNYFKFKKWNQVPGNENQVSSSTATLGL
jgi:hypothetical protein